MTGFTARDLSVKREEQQRMKGLFRSKYTLFLTFGLMAALCVYLNLTAGSLDYTNIIISAAMFVIVFAIFCFAFAKMATIDNMIDDLENATEEIRSDFKAERKFLWDSYRVKENLFLQPILKVRYREFTSEVLRMEELSGDLYRCDIGDYINQDLIDDSISRNILNLVSGTMTGLGILGTFIGLTIGLQQFNTGSASEITNSISPLIQGIKVAFHTSIYGMVFSLIFSFVYKNKLDQAQEALERFLDAYENYVMPDARNEGFRQMLALQKKQAEGTGELVYAFGERLGDKLKEILIPEFDRMNSTVSSFAQVATRAQLEGLEQVVDKFLDRMNLALNGAFNDLSRTIGETVEWEQQNRVYMQQILEQVGSMTADLGSMSAMTQQAVSNMSSYLEQLNALEEGINGSMSELQKQISTNTDLSNRQQHYIETLVAYEKQISDSFESYSRKMAEQLAFMQRMESKISEISKRNIEDVSKTAQEAGQMLAKTAATAGETMQKSAQYSADTVAQSATTQMNNMLKLSGSVNDELKKSTEELNKSTDAMSKQLTASLKSTYDTISRMQEELEGLVYSMDVLRRNTQAVRQLNDN